MAQPSGGAINSANSADLAGKKGNLDMRYHHHLVIVMIGMGIACRGSDAQEGSDSAATRDETGLEHAAGEQASPMAPDGEAATMQVLAVYIDGENVAPGQPPIEVIRSDERFSEIITTLGAKAGFGLPRSDGSRWYPTINFDSEVVLWLYPGLSSLDATFADFSLADTAEAMTLSYTLGTRSCGTVSADGYPYAFIAVPKVDKAYNISQSSPALNCP